MEFAYEMRKIVHQTQDFEKCGSITEVGDSGHGSDQGESGKEGEES